LTFDDIQEPELGGRYDMLLNGTGPQQMLDNMTVDGDGNLILQATRPISRASGNSIRAEASSSKSRNTTRRALATATAKSSLLRRRHSTAMRNPPA
jgi:hypothetical protein